MNNTVEPVPKFDRHSQVKVVIHLVLFIISLSGNLVTLVFMLRRRRQTSKYVRGFYNLIFHLCIADLSVTFLYLLTESIWSITIQWYAGKVLCRVVKFCQCVSIQASSYIVVVIGIDRVQLIVRSTRVSDRCILLSIVAVWTLSSVLALPQAIMSTVQRGPWKQDFYQCRVRVSPSFWEKQVYPLLSVVASFLLPLLLMLACYGFIMVTILRHGAPASPGSTCWSISHGQRDTPSTATTNPVLPLPLLPRNSITMTTAVEMLHASRNTFLNRAKMKSLHISATILVTYLLTRAPYWLYYFLGLTSVLKTRARPALSEMSHYFFWLSTANSALNPLIYGYFNNLWLLHHVQHRQKAKPQEAQLHHNNQHRLKSSDRLVFRWPSPTFVDPDNSTKPANLLAQYDQQQQQQQPQQQRSDPLTFQPIMTW